MANVSDKCWEEWISKKAVANAGVVVVDSHNQVLLLFKEDEGEWGIPSGGIDKDEEPEDAAIRELKEEAHIELSRNQLIQLGTVTAKHNGYKQDKTDIIVTFLAYSDELGKKGREHTKLNWYPLGCRHSLPKIHPTTQEQLRKAWEVVKTG